VLRVPGLRSLISSPLHQVGFHAVAFPKDSRELFWLGSLLALSAPGLVSAVFLVRWRAEHQPFRRPLIGRMAWVSILVPFVAVAIVKFIDPWHALSPTMSGDGRNHFLFIEAIRVQSNAPVSPFTLSSPLLSNTVGALLSSGNGASGTLQRLDLEAMLSVYVVSASILIFSIVAGFVTARTAPMRTRVGALGLVACAALVATNSFLLSTALRDGFFSLYFGVALLGAFLVLNVFLPVGALRVAILTAGVVAMIGAYSFIAPVLGVVLLVESFRWLATLGPPRRRVIFLVAWSAILLVGGFVAVRRNWDAFEETASLYGGITPIDSGILWVLLALAAAFWLSGSGAARSAGFTGVIAVVTGLVVVFFIERIPANQAPGFSYYASKTIVGTAAAVLCLSFIPLGARADSSDPRRSARWVAAAGLIAAALVPYAIAEEASSLARPWSNIRHGWVSPDSPSIPAVVARWGEDPYLVFRYGNNMPLAQRPNWFDDRALNFWSPVTWSSEGEWAAMYQWVYNDAISSDAAILCAPIDDGVQTIFTSDPALEGDIDTACGTPDVDVVVLPEVGPDK
jgi:hypothetical protein